MQGQKDGCREWPVEGESLFSYKGEPLPFMPFVYKHPDYWRVIATESKRTGNMINSWKLFNDSEKAHPHRPKKFGIGLTYNICTYPQSRYHQCLCGVSAFLNIPSVENGIIQKPWPKVNIPRKYIYTHTFIVMWSQKLYACCPIPYRIGRHVLFSHWQQLWKIAPYFQPWLFSSGLVSVLFPLFYPKFDFFQIFFDVFLRSFILG